MMRAREEGTGKMEQKISFMYFLVAFVGRPTTSYNMQHDELQCGS